MRKQNNTCTTVVLIPVAVIHGTNTKKGNKVLTTNELIIRTKEIVLLSHTAWMVSFEAVPERHQEA